MSTTEWSLDIKIVKDGPIFKDKGSFDMEGYNRVDVIVPMGGSQEVSVHGGDLKDIHLLYIRRNDQQEVTGEGQATRKRKLTYTFGSQTEPIELTDLHVVMGAGASRLLCDAPNELCFVNEGEQDADITILVCREASTDCEPTGGGYEEEDKEPENKKPEGGYEKPPSGQYPPQQEDPPQGQYPPQQQDPPQGQYPSQQQDPPQQDPPQGQYPSQQQDPPQQDPPQGEYPSR